MSSPRHDELAQQYYGRRYSALSPFGQERVRTALNNEQSSGNELTMNDIDLVRALDVAQKRLAAMEQANSDLWEENEGLRLQLMEKDESSTDRDT
jgi:hypothetical protein